MHESSMNRMKEFVAEYLDPNKPLRILDVGSYGVNGLYRYLFNNSNWKYFGMDLEAGKNADIVAKGPYNWDTGQRFDVIISGQCLEHIKDLKEWIFQINENLKPGGIVCIVAPWAWEDHRYPVACWRILPDGMRFLLGDVCDFEILKIFKQETDCVGIAIKRKEDRGISPKISSLRYQQGIIDLGNENSSHALTVKLVGTKKEVLEVGPSTGYVTRLLKARHNKVTCIELDKESAEIAKKFCDRMIIGDIESLDLDSFLKAGQFDVILFADVLEHLRWPGSVLQRIKKYLKPDGFIVASIPNIGHGDVILNLMNQKFTYTPTGLLDLTHLRFFTLPTVRNLFDASGYKVCHLMTTKIAIGGTEQGETTKRIPTPIKSFVEQIPFSNVCQFVVTAYLKENKSVHEIAWPVIDLSEVSVDGFDVDKQLLRITKELTRERSENMMLRAELISVQESRFLRAGIRIHLLLSPIRKIWHRMCCLTKDGLHILKYEGLVSFCYRFKDYVTGTKQDIKVNHPDTDST
jgi:2-polyprenyl-3-methyl-5-hydroxy-6-metoxy-1,4-benzoquinol methylase